MKISAPLRLCAILFFCLPLKAEIKNVLFLISDDLKASVLGCYGDKICKTPNIDKLAANGMLFERAYCQGVACAPSRTSFMHSRYLGGGTVNMGEHFKNNNIYTARVGKIYHMKVPGDIIAGSDGGDIESSWTERFNSSGLEAHTPGDYALLNHDIFTTETEGRVSTAMQDRWFTTVSYDGDGSDQPDYKTADKTIELLQKHKDAPFFIAAGFVRPHYPNVAPKQYFNMYDWRDIDLPYVPEDDLDDIPEAGMAKTMSTRDPIGKLIDNQKRMWAAYYATVTFVDDQVGRILDELDRLGLRENTAVVFTSDHGYHLGEHHFWQKSNIHEDVMRVPLIISAPGMIPGRTMALTELMDLYPTLSELFGINLPESVQGKSVVPVLKNKQASVRNVAMCIGKGDSYMLRSKDWAYLVYKDKSEELYHMGKDPKQFTNLANHPEHTPRLEDFRAILKKNLAKYEIKSSNKKSKR